MTTLKPTIENLTIQKTFYKRDRDLFGNRTREPYLKGVKREVQLVTGWKRFGHYMIDAVIIALLHILLEYVVYFGSFNIETPKSGIIGVMLVFIPTFSGVFVTVGYYLLCEGAMQRTIGKFVTGAVVIDQYAEKPSLGALIGRSFARMVPFEALSCLADRGWHDRWFKTYVVKVEERDALKKLIREQNGNFISDSVDLLD